MQGRLGLHQPREVHIRALPLSECVTLSKLLDLSAFQLSHLKMGMIIIIPTSFDYYGNRSSSYKKHLPPPTPWEKVTTGPAILEH